MRLSKRIVTMFAIVTMIVTTYDENHGGNGIIGSIAIVSITVTTAAATTTTTCTTTSTRSTTTTTTSAMPPPPLPRLKTVSIVVGTLELVGLPITSIAAICVQYAHGLA